MVAVGVPPPTPIKTLASLDVLEAPPPCLHRHNKCADIWHSTKSKWLSICADGCVACGWWLFVNAYDCSDMAMRSNYSGARENFYWFNPRWQQHHESLEFHFFLELLDSLSSYPRCDFKL